MQRVLWLLLFINLSCSSVVPREIEHLSPVIYIFDRDGGGLVGDNAEGGAKQFIHFDDPKVDKLMCMPEDDLQAMIIEMRERK